MNHLTSMKLLDFRSHRSTNIELAEGVTLFCGQVGRGKSSIPLALSICLTGRNALTDGKGSGSREQIRLGADHWQVNANFSDGLGVIRSRNEKDQTLVVNIPNVPNKLAAQEAAILMKFGLSAETLAALLDVTPLTGRKREEQKALLLKVLRPEVFQLDPEMLKLCAKYGYGSPSSIEDVQRVYDLSYKDRAAAKKQQKDIVVPVQPEIVEVPKAADPVEVQKRIQELRAQQTGLIRSMSDAEAVIEQYDEAIGGADQSPSQATSPTEEQESAAKEAVKVAREAEKPIEEEIRRLEPLVRGKKEPECTLPTDSDMQLALIALEEAKADESSVRDRGSNLKAEGQRLEVALGLSGSTECPTCLQVVLPKHRERLEVSAAALVESFQSVKAEYGAVKDKLNAAQAEYDRLALKWLFADRAALRETLAVVLSARSEAEAVAESIQAARAGVKLLAKLEPKVAKAREELPGLRTQLEETEKKLARAQTVLEDVSRVTREINDWNAANEAKRACAERVLDLETVTDYFSPRGIQAKMLEAWTDNFLTTTTERMALCGLGAVTINFEPFYLSVGGVQLEQLSGGQKFLLETCWRLSVAELTGFHIAVLDDLNNLGGDHPMLDAFAAMLKTAPEVQTIISRTTDDPEDTKALLAKIPGKAFFISTGADGAAQVKEV